MFSKCSSLKKLDFSNINTNKVTNMEYMFSECSSLEELNIYNFTNENASKVEGIFEGCFKLKNISELNEKVGVSQTCIII